ncbi:hypothetical protein KVR01_013208 [Diaporthe batatas]|uniref:uncharacterized protein n=1 Tax=Diaporthe batatas TaxID=748121 RepID=UPI001D039C73|nr:uncharacterized protein KVR01_013208 [Diaporthe batatas]KAG8156986.1 hypothetical protein KVR01_013208 [Diaporthe batatas]
MSSIRYTLIKTATSYIEGFNTNSPDGVIAARTPDCKQIVRPSTVPSSWYTSPWSNKEYQDFIIPGFKKVRDVKISLVEGEDMLVDDTLRQVLLHLKSTGETDYGPYANEYMIVLKMTDDGSKIKEIVEFVDSATTRDIAQAIASGAVPKPE